MTADPDYRPSAAGTAVLIALAVGGWLAAMFALFTFVPPAKKRFDEFGLQLPRLTARLIDLGDATGPLALPLTVGVPLLLAGTVYVCRNHVRSRGLRWLGLLAAFSVPALAAAVIGLALVLPMVKLAEGLNK